MSGPRLRDAVIAGGLAAALIAVTPVHAEPQIATPAGAGSSARSHPQDAGADLTDAQGLDPAPDAGAAGDAIGGSCAEHIPEGKQRPRLTEKFAERGVSGHVAWLEIVLEHGQGETVLPDGFRLQSGSEQMEAVEQAGFMLPHPDGGAGPTLQRQEEGEQAKTTVRVPVVPLPAEPGRHTLRLPPLPLAVARASGEVMTLCTQPHSIVVEDPIANVADAQPHMNPPPRRQLEEWTTAKHVAYAALVALLVGALVAWLLGKWLRRPRPVPPPPPPRPPWEVALEELHDIRLSGLIEAGRFAEHFDRVSFAIRRYLGDRYGFDGLESTTREILGVLNRVVPPVAVLPTIKAFLRQADLVKFARLTPNVTQCQNALEQGEQIVQKTIPAFTPVAESSGSETLPAATGEAATLGPTAARDQGTGAARQPASIAGSDTEQAGEDRHQAAGGRAPDESGGES